MERIIHIKPAFQDGRGEIHDLLEYSSGIKHIGLITSRAGAVRGKHYHKKATQYTYVLEGQIALITRDFRDPANLRKTETLKDGDIACIPPFMIHTVKSLTKSTILILTTECREGSDGFEQDTFRIKDL